MALAGFRAKNHPQQVARRGASDTVDERITPGWLFEQLHAEHGFDLDVAANAENAKLPAFFDLESDGLAQSWAGRRVWCNPPYSALAAWVAKAEAEAKRGALVVMLLPANRTEQRWWQNHVEPHRDRPGSGVTVRFLPRRINFGVPGNEAGRFNSSTPFGLVIVTWVPAVQAVPAPLPVMSAPTRSVPKRAGVGQQISIFDLEDA